MHRGCSWVRRKVRIVGGHPVVFIEEPLLAKLRSSEVDIVALALPPAVQMGLPASFPYSPLKGLACILPVCPAATDSLFFCLWAAFDILQLLLLHNMWNSVGKSKPSNAGVLVAVALVPECWQKQQLRGGWVPVLCLCLSNGFLSLPRLAYTLVEKKEVKGMWKSFCHVYSGVSSVLQ